MPAPARSRRILGILLAAVLLGVAAVAAAMVMQGGTAPPAAAPVVSEVPGPVLLVPGYGGDTTILEPLADRLRGAGRDVTVVELPGSGVGDLRASAEALDAAASAALAGTGATRVDVVGYSAGGLVARLWIAAGSADVVRRVLTLGTPHHGTELAQLGARYAPDRCAEACRQMLPDSELLSGLNADEIPDGVEFVSVWTAQDRVVTPAESARLDGALNLPVQSVCADRSVSHRQLPGDPVVQAIVESALGVAQPAVLTPADCARLGG